LEERPAVDAGRPGPRPRPREPPARPRLGAGLAPEPRGQMPALGQRRVDALDARRELDLALDRAALRVRPLEIEGKLLEARPLLAARERHGRDQAELLGDRPEVLVDREAALERAEPRPRAGPLERVGDRRDLDGP